MKKTLISSNIDKEISTNLNDNQLTDEYMGTLTINNEFDYIFNYGGNQYSQKLGKECLVDVYGPNIRANEKGNNKLLFLRSGDGKFLSRGLEEVLSSGRE